MIRALLLLMFAVLAAAPLNAQDAGGGAAYVIAGIPVDTSAKTTYDARMAAYRIARQKAWPLLWTRLTGEPAASAPRLGDAALDQMVSGIEIEGERFSTTRYIATLGVVFDRGRASAHFEGKAGAQHSGPMLLLPVFSDGATRILYQRKTPWTTAWSRFSEGLSPINYVLASGSAGDNVLLTAYQTARADRPLWRNILNRFGSTDVLIAEVRLTREFPGGPVAAQFIARHGPDATELGRFGLRTGNSAGLDAMLDVGVRKVDEIFTQAFHDGRLTADPDLTTELEPILSLAPDITGGSGAAFGVGGGIETEVATPDARSWSELEALLRGTPTVTAVNLTSLSLGGVSRLVIRHSDTDAMLLYQLDQRGLRLVQSQGGGNLLRRRQAGDVPIPMPVPVIAADLSGADVVGDQPAAPTPPARPTAPPATLPTAPAPATPPRTRTPPPSAAPPPSAPPPAPAPGSAPVDLFSGAQPK